MGNIKDRIENLEEEFRLLETLDNQNKQDITKLALSFGDIKYNTKQDIEFLKAEIQQLNLMLKSVNEALTDHYDKIHKLEIKPNLELLDNDKHEICSFCNHRLKDCLCENKHELEDK